MFYITDTYIQQAKRKFTDKNRYAMSQVNNELKDVQRIMVSNIEDVIHRGEALNSKYFNFLNSLIGLVCFWSNLLQNLK